MKRFLLISMLTLGGIPVAAAHEVRPAYLEIRETGPQTYDFFWKIPARGENLRLALQVILPSTCAYRSPVRTVFTQQASIDRWTSNCAEGLTGKNVRVGGLEATVTDVLVRYERLDGTSQTARLLPSNPEVIIESAPRRSQVVTTYLKLGVEHILGGVDHLLFVFALILLIQNVFKIIKTVTAFTISHSITLSLAALGFVRMPPAPVEAAIALSIVFVALEIVRLQQGQSTLTARYPWMIAFIFGLMHGLGFAGALTEIGLPQKFVVEALLFFSVGVEMGHFAFVAVTLAAMMVLKSRRVSWPRWVIRVPPYAIGAVASYWLIERVSGF